MSTEIQTVTLTVSLNQEATPDEVQAATADELNEKTTQLYRALLDSDADYVEKLRSDSFEPGGKGDPITIGAIVLGLSVAATPGIIDIVKAWLARRHLESVTVKVKLGEDEIEFPAPASATQTEIEALTERFMALLKKHGEAGAAATI